MKRCQMGEARRTSPKKEERKKKEKKKKKLPDVLLSLIISYSSLRDYCIWCSISTQHKEVANKKTSKPSKIIYTHDSIEERKAVIKCSPCTIDMQTDISRETQVAFFFISSITTLSIQFSLTFSSLLQLRYMPLLTHLTL